MKRSINQRKILTTALCTALATTTVTMATTAHAQSTVHEASMASGMSATVPIAMVGLSAATVISGATVLTVKTVELSARGTAVVVQGVANGVSQTVRFTVDAAHGFAVGAGTVLSAASVAGGVLLYEGSRAVALIPNQAGRHLMHHERLTF